MVPPAGSQQHRQTLTLSAGARRAQFGPRQGFAGGADGIKRVRLCPVAPLGALGAVQLHHHLAAGGEQAGQPGAMPAGAFHRPDPQRRVLTGEVHQGLIALGRCRRGHLAKHPAGAGIDRRGAMGSHVGIDPDDDLSDLRQTNHAFISLPAGT
jgi:hypothetical protein